MPRNLLRSCVVGLISITALATRAADLPPATRPASQPAGAADPATYLADFCRAARVKWPKNHALTVVFHGHSVPAGYAKTPDVRPFDAYPHQLRVALNERFPFAVMNVITTAIGGEASEKGAARFERDVLPLRPDVVFIDYALNDRKLGPERTRVAWQGMIDQCRQHGIPVVLLTPTIDLGSKLSDPADPLNVQAEMIRALAVANHVGLADSLAAFKAAIAAGTPPESLMAQSNHPNHAGHALVVPGLLKWFPDE